MRKTEFIEVMKDNAKQYGEVTLTEVKRPGNTYTGLTLKIPNTPVPVVNLDMVYAKYSGGEWTLEKCFDYLEWVLKQELDAPVDIKQITKWGNAKGRLYIRLCGDIDGEGVFRKVEDLYLIPYLQMSDDGSATVRVTKDLLTVWGVDEDTVFDTAESNQETLRPVKIITLAEHLGISSKALPVYIVSTKSGICGASAIFYEGVFADLKDKIGGDYYIIPSSTHEVLVVPKSLNDDVEGLVAMVTMINQDHVEEKDRLTNSIYTFDFEENVFRRVG